MSDNPIGCEYLKSSERVSIESDELTRILQHTPDNSADRASQNFCENPASKELLLARQTIASLAYFQIIKHSSPRDGRRKAETMAPKRCNCIAGMV
jgi:hypothetical protein